MIRLMMLRPIRPLNISFRLRASYYKPREKGMRLPRPLRKFLYKYPMAPIYVTLGMVIYALMAPAIQGARAYFILDREDYADFKAQHDAVSLNRARYGTDWYIPFFGPNKSMETFEFYKKRTEKRRADKLEKKEAN